MATQICTSCFSERALSLVRHGGRIGIVLPSGFAVRSRLRGAAAALLDRTDVDTFVSIENRDGAVPHPSRPEVPAGSRRPPGGTRTASGRPGVRSPDAAGRARRHRARPVSGPDPPVPDRTAFRAISSRFPELRTARDAAHRVADCVLRSALGDPRGMERRVRTGAERDGRSRGISSSPAATGRRPPVIEGKQIAAVRRRRRRSRDTPSRACDAATLLDPARTYRAGASRVSRRRGRHQPADADCGDVPARVVTTHTLFCLKSDVDRRDPAVPLRRLQQLRGQLPGAASRRHARDRLHHRAASRAQAATRLARVPRRSCSAQRPALAVHRRTIAAAARLQAAVARALRPAADPNSSTCSTRFRWSRRRSAPPRSPQLLARRARLIAPSQ